jgi:isoleucyl-tRNA synthetase
MVNVNEISSQEDKINEFWKKAEIFRKSVEKKAPRGDFVFYDGPPFITGLPHYGTILPSIVKDTIPRFWTMKGFRVERVWGWDCHGLPAENKVEKELGLKNKKEIEKMGVGKFVCACKTYVNDVSGQWKWYIDKIGRWVDMKNAYKTMDINFMESVIWIFKELYSKGLIYEGYRSSLHCPRCATPLSKFEITMDAGSYKDVTETSIVAKFKLKKQFKTKNVFVLAWTTTPWTLPGNLALAVNEKIKYILVESDGENYIIAKERIGKIFGEKKYKLIEEVKGKDLVGLEYEPIFDLQNKKIKENKNSYKIYDADFVTTEDGTGVVHIAPNFGEDDFELGKKVGLPVIDLMDENGIYTKEAGEFKDLYFKDAGKEVMKKSQDNLFSKFNFTHAYPFCYRCETPLIYRTQKAWYLDTDKIRTQMLKTNEKINWVPDYFKEGRFKYNLENAPHWCLSRSRYWGSPIPVWKCEKCSEIKIVGSIKEIETLSGKKVKDLHRPEIDEHKFKCSCGGIMKRIPEIFDCWFESGAMPYAQWHYPFERKNDFKKIFPADFIIEYTGQLRGWFYYLHALSNSLFKSECFKNVMVTGVLAGTDGRKMSKSYGNYPDPKLTLEKYGGDAMRMYFLGSPVIVGGDMNINEKDIQDSLRKNVMLLYNVLNFYETSAPKKFTKTNSNNLIDRWIISRLNQITKEITESIEKYDLPSASRTITLFIDDLSWYLRLSRENLNEGDTENMSTMKEVLENISILIAPFMPFTSEYIWQSMTKNNFDDKNKSVHLESWSEADKKIDVDLLDKMKKLREIISIGLKQRDQNSVGLKWPLNKVIIYSEKLKGCDEIIKKQLNVKEIEFKSGKNLEVELDFNLTPELEAEGYARELSRNVQAFRKELGLQKKDKIELFIFVDEEFKKILKNQKEFIKERTNSKILKLGVATPKEKFKNKIDFNIKDKRGIIAIKY